MELSGRTVISASNFSMRSSRVVSADALGNSRTRRRALSGKQKIFTRRRIVQVTGRRLRGGRVEADLGRFALGWRGHFEKLACLEAQHAGKDVRGELLNFRVEVPYDGVVVAAG